MKTQYKLLLLILFNILFFTIFSNILPFHFEENDDVSMCMIANGTYSGIPDAHLTNIHYIYGRLLTVFYNTFPGIEWYTIFFGIIHIVSLTVIVSVILKYKDKPFWLKVIFLLFLYSFEIRIILLFQFTTTATICSFAALLLLLETKKLYKALGLFLFILAVLVRYEATLLILLLMLPVFLYRMLLDKKTIIASVIQIVICIICVFSLQFIDRQIYIKSGIEWADHQEYNKLMRISDVPNAEKIMDNLPEAISTNDYLLLSAFFPDVKVFNLRVMRELNQLIQAVPLKEKLKNIPVELGIYINWFILLTGIVILSTLTGKKKMRFYTLLCFVFFIGICMFISLNGFLKYRLFVTMLLPMTYYLFYFTDIQSFRNIKSMLFIGSFIIFISVFTFKTNERRQLSIDIENYNTKNLLFLDELRNKNITIINFGSNLQIEKICNPFNVSDLLKGFNFYQSGWLSNIPFNKGHYDSYASLLNDDTYLFISKRGEEWVVSNIQKALMENYQYNTEVTSIGNDEFRLLKFKLKE